MRPDRGTGHERRAAHGRASHAGTCARAGLFAVLGTVLAAVGHHTIAEGTLPWRPVGVMAAAQFVAVWPLARRRYTPAATIVCTLAAQGLLHLGLSFTDADEPSDMPGHALHAGHGAEVAGDGHAWHHAGTAMTLVHVVAALVVAWLLQRADARIAAGLGALATQARSAVTALAHALRHPARGAGEAMVAPPEHRPGTPVGAAAPARDDVLEHAVVRRGPPRRRFLQSVTRPRDYGTGSSRTSKEFPCVRCVRIHARSLSGPRRPSFRGGLRRRPDSHPRPWPPPPPHTRRSRPTPRRPWPRTSPSASSPKPSPARRASPGCASCCPRASPPLT